MKPYQERVVEEKSELVDKTDKLEQFLETVNNGVPLEECVSVAEVQRLSCQLNIMKAYCLILQQRIDNFA